MNKKTEIGAIVPLGWCLKGNKKETLAIVGHRFLFCAGPTFETYRFRGSDAGGCWMYFVFVVCRSTGIVFFWVNL